MDTYDFNGTDSEIPISTLAFILSHVLVLRLQMPTGNSHWIFISDVIVGLKSNSLNFSMPQPGTAEDGRGSES